MVSGLHPEHFPVGKPFRVGDEAMLEVTQIGKECHEDCAMPREGIFARVITGGAVRPGDRVQPIDGTTKNTKDDERE